MQSSSSHPGGSLHCQSISIRNKSVFFFRKSDLGGVFILRNRKRLILFSVLAGILCSALPFLFLLFHMHKEVRQLEHELLSYQELEDTYHSASVWVLNTSLDAGDTIQENACTKVIVKTQDIAQLSLLESPESIEGLSAKTSLQKGVVLSEDMFFDAGAHEEDTRLVDLTELILPSWLSKNDIVDIRIRFPNGEDYIVISHQKVRKLLADETELYGIQLELGEEELLRLSSARVDRELYSGCDIYITKYALDFQESSQKDYPVNPDVFTLMEWDPNIRRLLAVDGEQDKRTLLESHMEVFLQKGILGEGDSGSSATSDDISETDISDEAGEDSWDDSLTVYHP